MSGIVAILICLFTGGCASSRSYRIVAFPADADIVVDGLPAGNGAAIVALNPGLEHVVLVTRRGYADQTIHVDPSSTADPINVNLAHPKRKVSFNVTPVPAQIRVDGKALGDGSPIMQATAELEYSVDSTNQWITHTVSAQRPGYRTAERVILFNDPSETYVLALDVLRKDVTVKTDPPGAEVFLDDDPRGISPVQIAVEQSTNPQTNEWIRRRLVAKKKGYESGELTFTGENLQSTYTITLGVRTKAITLMVDPQDSIVRLADRILPHESNGVIKTTLQFTPDEHGVAPIHELTISPPASHPELQSKTVKIDWETSPELAIKLPAALSVATPAIVLNWVPEGARLVAQSATIKPQVGPQKDERPGVVVTRILEAGAGESIESLATSIDGDILTWSMLSNSPGGELRGRIWQRPSAMQRAGTPATAPSPVTDGLSLAIMPSFAPDGEAILFSESKDGGKSFQVVRAPLAGGMPTRIGDARGSDLWPSLDSLPQPRLFVASVADASVPGRLGFWELTANPKRNDLSQIGQQPRVSPLADAIVFTRPDPKTGKRDLYLLTDGAKVPINLTQSPDDDDFDPAWSKDGNRIAFASDRRETRPLSATAPRPADAERDLNIWVLDPTTPKKMIRITSNSAWDDSPAWNGNGSKIYFRSNREQKWGIWSIDVR